MIDAVLIGIVLREGTQMADIMLAKDAAKLWGITTRAVTALCKGGKIAGARKENGVWMMPADAERPADGRYSASTSAASGAPRSSHPVDRAVRLPLPVGISDYRLASTEYYYVDKTLMIRDFLDERPMVSLFTRPRRFGKTLNMDMLRTFFEKTDEDTSVLFRDKKIWACGQRYRSYQGRYPVIFLTFKDVKRDTWEETYEHIARLIEGEFLRHGELAESGALNEYEKAYYRRVVSGEGDQTDLISSLASLSEMLHKHHGEPAVIIIDEYDTPIQQGYLNDFYEPAVSFMRTFFSGGLKDNRHLAFGFLTGVLRAAKESVFSGLNNLAVNSVVEKKYSEYFGFTAAEVAEMAEYYGASNKLGEICDWYDGYRFGDAEIFNPWSVVSYFSAGCDARAYWVSSGDNGIIGEVLEHADEAVFDQLARLVQGEPVSALIDTSVVYPQIRSNPSSVFSLLLVCGYLKTVGPRRSFGGGDVYDVALPNREISIVYRREILDRLEGVIPRASAIGIQEAVCSGDVDALRERLNSLLKSTVSYFDTAKESFYHGLMLGLLAMTEGRYALSSNDESGDGRYDICLSPKQPGLPGIIVELKAERKRDVAELKRLAEDAIRQIGEKAYDAQLRQAGVTRVIEYGVAFSGKDVEVVSEVAEV